MSTAVELPMLFLQDESSVESEELVRTDAYRHSTASRVLPDKLSLLTISVDTAPTKKLDEF